MLSELASSRKRPFRNHARRGRDFRGRPSLAVAMASHFSGEEELPLRQDVKRNPRNLTCRAGLWRPPRPSPGEDGCAPARLFYSGSTPPTHRMGAHLDVAQAQARSSSLTDGRSQDRPQPGGRSHPGQPSPFGRTAGSYAQRFSRPRASSGTQAASRPTSLFSGTNAVAENVAPCGSLRTVKRE